MNKLLSLLIVVVLVSSFVFSSKALAASDCDPVVNSGYCHPCYATQLVYTYQWQTRWYFNGWTWVSYTVLVPVPTYQQVLEWHWYYPPQGDWGPC